MFPPWRFPPAPRDTGMPGMTILLVVLSLAVVAAVVAVICERRRVIEIKKSQTADTRTCDWSKVDREQLLLSSLQHIGDVAKGLGFFAGLLTEAAVRHDFDKISNIDGFHRDFATGFKQTTWWDEHRKLNRHHISVPDGVPADVNLIDVLDHIVDCVMAGMARSGGVYELKLPDDVLRAAFRNTVAMLKANVQLEKTN